MTGKVSTTVSVRSTEAVIVDEVKVVALDGTNASELLTQFEANKANKAILEAEYKSLQAEVYALLGYKKYGDKWIGVAQEGTIGGVAVVKVGVQSRPSFQVDAFVVAHPELLSEVEAFTDKTTFTVLKTVR